MNNGADHCAEATGYLRELLGEHYIYSNAPAYKTLWENYSFCRFVEDEGLSLGYIGTRQFLTSDALFCVSGDVVFYKNKQGQAVRRPGAEYQPRPV